MAQMVRIVPFMNIVSAMEEYRLSSSHNKDFRKDLFF